MRMYSHSVGPDTFSDIKFYVPSRENSRILDRPLTFLPGVTEILWRYLSHRTAPEVLRYIFRKTNKELRRVIPPSHPYAEHWGYLSDNDLDDGFSCSKEEDEERDHNPLQGLEDTSGPKTSQIPVSDDSVPRPLSVETDGTQ